VKRPYRKLAFRGFLHEDKPNLQDLAFLQGADFTGFGQGASPSSLDCCFLQASARPDDATVTIRLPARFERTRRPPRFECFSLQAPTRISRAPGPRIPCSPPETRVWAVLADHEKQRLGCTCSPRQKRPFERPPVLITVTYLLQLSNSCARLSRVLFALRFHSAFSGVGSTWSLRTSSASSLFHQSGAGSTCSPRLRRLYEQYR
jgi:hypothetical protein